MMSVNIHNVEQVNIEDETIRGTKTEFRVLTIRVTDKSGKVSTITLYLEDDAEVKL